MIKKIIVSLALAITPFLFASAHAVQFTSVSEIKFSQSSNDTPFWQLIITADEFDEINVPNGLNIILPKGLAIQWDLAKSPIQLSGNAANKVVPGPTVSEDLYILHFDVQTNFSKGDVLQIDGLTPVTFDQEISGAALSLDITGNNIRDIDNFYPFSVKSVSRTDIIAPYDPKDFKAIYNEKDKNIKLTWENPANYDFWQTTISRTRTVEGKTETIDVHSGADENFIDNSVKDGEVSYVIHAVDKSGNNSGAVKATIIVGEKSAEVTPPATTTPVTTTPATTTTTTSTETTLLTKLFDYYYIRYQIKCLVTGTDPEGSLCLATKTDLVYAQEKLGKVKASDAKITTRDVYLMNLRLKWPELRYKNECTDATTPANYCPALKDSIDRQKYFINK